MSLKLLQYHLQKNNHQGVTTAEALILFLILAILFGGFLMFGTLPFLSTTNRIKGSEAKSNIGAMNRAQQAYFLEKSKFAQSIKEMDIGIKEQTQNYAYYTKVRGNAAFNYAVARRSHINQNFFDRKPIKSMIGAVFTNPSVKKDELNTVAILCENNQPGKITPKEPIYKDGFISCAEGTIKI
ncbi:MAG TPA: type IV pilin-like G/H family protein [Nostocaceae cyanobacterium]|nr:type IV pilin-like G/H family protein [Nostocaceae cyanobacterium]